jgi:hypothetical protein
MRSEGNWLADGKDRAETGKKPGYLPARFT